MRSLVLAIWVLTWAGPGAAASDIVPQDWRGTWVVERDLGASAVSALSSSEVQALLGTKLSLNDRTTRPGGDVCASPKFEISQESAEDIASEFRVQASELRLTGSFSILAVRCETEGYSLLRLGGQRILLIYRGHLFLGAKI